MGSTFASRRLALLVVVCASLCSTACTLLGAGIGANTPRWEEGVSTEKLASCAEAGGSLEVRLRPAAAAYGPDRLRGACGSLDAENVVVVTDQGERRIPLRDIARVDLRRGNYVTTGLAVGLLIDAVSFVALAAILYANDPIRLGKRP